MSGSNPDLTGQQRIARAFSLAKDAGRAAFMPYFPLGYPDRDRSLAVIESIAAESDLLELGIPFSDPIADGPTIQQSTQQALNLGTTTAACLEMLRDIRLQGITTPALFMGYYNPILAYGETAFVRDASRAGADGLIVPDLPPEEADNLARAAADEGLALIYFLTPTSTTERVALVLERARGFIYMVSLTGVTGARSSVRAGLSGLIDAIRQKTDVPVAVGFGISTPAQAAEVGAFADGVIVGSALVNAVADADGSAEAARVFAASMRRGLQKGK